MSTNASPSYKCVVPAEDYNGRIFGPEIAGPGSVTVKNIASPKYSVPQSGPAPLVHQININCQCVVPVHFYPGTAVTLFVLDGCCVVALFPLRPPAPEETKDDKPFESVVLSRFDQPMLYIPAGQPHCVFTREAIGVYLLAQYESVRVGSQPEIIWEVGVQ